MTGIQADVVLVGGGIMSATLAMLLRRLDPRLHILMLEQLPDIAQESSAPLHNAGTGHAGYCELNYTPADARGQVDIHRALGINESFELSLQFWSHLAQSEPAKFQPGRFIHRVPHLSAVFGEAAMPYLQARYRAMQAHHLFADMEWSTDPATLMEWMPLLMHGRSPAQPVAATRVAYGSDVNFGALTRSMVQCLQQQGNFELLTQTRVRRLQRVGTQGRWRLAARRQPNGDWLHIEAPFVFLGAGGHALRLLQKSGIPEAAGYGGFPVSGQWLICQDPALVQQHHAKVYSLAPVGAPPCLFRIWIPGSSMASLVCCLVLMLALPPAS